MTTLAIAAAATAAGGALSAGSKIMASREEARSTLFEQQQLETAQQQKDLQLRQFELGETQTQDLLKREGERYKTAAAEAEAYRRNDLISSIETIMSIRAGRGVGEGSPTATAILSRITRDAERDIGTERLNYANRIDETRMGIETSRGQVALARGQNELSQSQVALSRRMARKRAKFSLLAGYLGAADGVAAHLHFS
jgi:hypothetical protein